MRLSFITDEATQSFREALDFAGANGLQGLELRSAEGMAIHEIPGRTLTEWRSALASEGLAVPCLASSLGKCPPEDRAGEGEKLRRLLDAADILGTDLIRAFAFFAPASGRLDPDCLADCLAPLGEAAARRGKRLLLEADPSVNTTNHAALAAVLSRLDPGAFGAVYDPGNDLYDPLGERPYPDGYDAIAPRLVHVHVKDALPGPGGPQCLAPGLGAVGWPAVLRRLRAQGYTGWLSLETHYRKGLTLTEEQMRLPSGADFTRGGFEATRESAAALRALLKETE